MNTTSQLNTNPDALVELRDIRFGYGERVILDGITLTVPRGKVTALMGASGGGKDHGAAFNWRSIPRAVWQPHV